MGAGGATAYLKARHRGELFKIFVSLSPLDELEAKLKQIIYMCHNAILRL